MSLMRRVLVVLVALALVPSATRGEDRTSTIPDDVFTLPPAEDLVDLVVLGAGRSAVVRMHVQVGNRPYRAAYRQFVERLHAFLDANDDHRLTLTEANRSPWTTLTPNLLGGTAVTIRRPVTIDGNGDGAVTIDELAEYLRQTQGYEPLTPAPGPTPDVRPQALFQRLDRNNDAAISLDELRDADRLLSSLDADEDEILSLDELTPDRSPLPRSVQLVNASRNRFNPAESRAVPLTLNDAEVVMARQLLQAFGKGSPLAVGPEPLGAASRDFQAADSDHDGRLDRAELARYLESPTVHLELSLTFPTPRTGQGRIARLGASDASSPVREGTNGELTATLAGAEFVFAASEPLISRSSVFMTRFDTADRDRNGSLSVEESRTDGTLQRIFLVGDRDGDHAMTRRELSVYAALADASEEARMFLAVYNVGDPLHDQLDADNDQRLSLRELRGARTRLAGLDSDRDGKVSRSDLPRRTRVNLGRGLGALRLLSANVVSTTISQPSFGGRPGDRPWFTGMDRNHDGDVSEREFLGPTEQFLWLDTDGDGLISRAEAARTR